MSVRSRAASRSSIGADGSRDFQAFERPVHLHEPDDRRDDQVEREEPRTRPAPHEGVEPAFSYARLTWDGMRKALTAGMTIQINGPNGPPTPSPVRRLVPRCAR